MRYTRLEKAFHSILVAISHTNNRQALEQIQEVLVKLSILIHDRLLETHACHPLGGK